MTTLSECFNSLAARLRSDDQGPRPITAAGAWSRLWPDMAHRGRVVLVAAFIGLIDGASNLALAGVAASPLRLAAGALAVGLVVAPSGPAIWRAVESSGRRRRHILLALGLASFACAWLVHVAIAAIIATIRAAALLGLATAFGWGLWHRRARRKEAKRRRRQPGIPDGYALVPIREPTPSPPSREP